jgi:hypothetical protein
MNLRPAIHTPEGLIIGEISDSHKALMKKNKIDEVKDDHKGFTPNGKIFLNRIQAVEFLRKYEPGIYKKVKDEVSEGLHTHIYAKAKGVDMEKEEEPLKIIPAEQIDTTPEFEKGVSEI